MNELLGSMGEGGRKQRKDFITREGLSHGAQWNDNGFRPRSKPPVETIKNEQKYLIDALAVVHL